MSLLQLPLELLSFVIRYLGLEFFRQDIRRLTVFKQWYACAWQLLAKDLHLTPGAITRLAGEEIATLVRIQPYVKTAALVFEGRSPSGENVENAALNGDASSTLEWSARLNTALTTVAAQLKQCPKLRHLRVKAEPECNDLSLLRISMGQGYLMPKPVDDFLSLRHLTSLEFDIAGSFPQGPTDNGSVHFCASINLLLPSLRRLHCRMNAVCETLLERPKNDSPLQLEEIIVNLSLSELSSTSTSCRFPKRCQPVPGESFTQLRQSIERQASTLALGLDSPRIVRVITHRIPSLSIEAFDAITGQRLGLENNMQWDADGEVVGSHVRPHNTDLFQSDDDDTSSSETE